MNILFFGTPHIAVPYLLWLTEHQTVVGVISQPDKPAGRGYSVQPTPVKSAALEKKIPVFQPSGPWMEDTLQPLRDLKADVGIVVAYGRILPEGILKEPRLGCINIHFSLLPKYRGAAPMQWALINGEKETGVSAFWLDQGMDTGPIFHQKNLSIDPADNVVALREKLIPLGVQVLSEVMTALEKGTIVKNPQMGAPSPAPLLKKEDGMIKWNVSPQQILNRIRGVVEWPGATTFYTSADGKKKRLKIFKASLGEASSSKDPGTILQAGVGEGILVQADGGSLTLATVQPEGKEKMTAGDFWRGARLKIGDSFLSQTLDPFI